MAVYTVPAGRTAVIRTMTVTNTSSSDDGNFAVRVNGTSSGFGLFENVDLPAFQTWVQPEEICLDPGDVLYMLPRNVATNVFRTFGFGSLLLGAPE